MNETTTDESSKLDSAEKLEQDSQSVVETSREEIDQRLEERKQAEEKRIPGYVSFRSRCYFRPVNFYSGETPKDKKPIPRRTFVPEERDSKDEINKAQTIAKELNDQEN